MNIHVKKPTDVALLSGLYELHIAQTKEAQDVMFAFLKEHRGSLSLELGEELEEIANRYLDMSEMISERYLSSLREEHALLSRTRSAVQSSG
jgi:hypothetical protein